MKLKNDREKLAWVAVLALAAFVLFYKLGANHLIEYDEGIYALVANNILKTGDLVTLHWQLNLPWFDKGPLYLWLTALTIELAGPTAGSVRFWSAFLGLASIISVFLIGRRLFNWQTGFLAAVILSSTVGYLYYARLGMLDVPNAAFNSLSLLFLIESTENPRKLRLAAIFLALGFLNRGLLTFFGLAAFLPYLAVSQNWKIYSRAEVAKSGLIMALILLPWHLLESLRFGGNFWQVYLGHQMLLRFAQTIEGKNAPFWWYVEVVRTHFRIWFLVLLPALLFSFFELWRKKKEDLLILSWALTTFLVLTVAASKLIWYILPIYPSLALLCGRFLAVVGEKLKARKAVLILVFIIAIFYDFKSWGRIQTVDFTQDLFSLVAYKNKIDPGAPLLDVSYGPSVTAFYSLGPVSQIPAPELRGLLDGRRYNYAVISRGDFEKLQNPPPLKIVYGSGDGLLLSVK